MARLHQSLLIVLIGFAPTGCMTKPSLTQEEVVSQVFDDPSTAIRAKWKAAANRGEVPDGGLTSFNDPAMEKVVGEALAKNFLLRGAAAQVDVAAGMAVKAAAGLKPVVGAGADLAGIKAAGLDATSTSGVGLGASWEIDLWGRLSSIAKAGEEQFKAAEADFGFARQSLAAMTAKNWYLASEALQQEALAEETVTILTRLVKIVTAKQEVGQIPMQDLRLARADLAAAEDRRRSATLAREQAVRALEILLGRYPSAEFEVRPDFVPVPPPVPAGVPSQVLERRADLVAAERRVAAAFQGVQAARLAKLPRIALTAGGGFGSSDLLSLLNAGPGFFQAGANFFFPIDTTGAIQADVDIATAQQEQALAGYGQAALVAFGEVENGLSGERLLAEREAYLASATEDNAEAYNLTNKQYEVGKIDLLSVLQVQTRWLGARSALLSLQRARLTNRINLHLALGGDFELEEGE